MDSDQRLRTLQKTYAEMIVNTSNEAAEKVLVAERKAQQLEHKLQVTKDESVQMLARLKKMKDDKINEAKMTSLNQEEKINELEAQLQEAEDIESKLREELRYVQGKCERVSRNDVQYPKTHENATLKEISEDNRQSQSHPSHLRDLDKDFLVASDKENLCLNQRTEYPKCCGDAIQERNLYGIMPEVPSILRRSKKQKEAICKDGCIRCFYEVQPIESILKTIEAATKTEYMKKTIASRKEIPDRLFRKIHETPGVPHSNTTPKSIENMAQPNEGPTCVVPKLPSDVTGTVTECAKTTKTSDNNDEGDAGELSSKGEPPVDLLVPIVQESASTEYQVVKPNLNKVNESTPLPELKTINATSKGPSLQFFKYTFQRKRKRET